MSKARVVLVTGSAGLIGSETVRRFAADGLQVVGLDNDLRRQFFGEEASTRKTRDTLLANVPAYEHHEIDIRDAAAVNEIFKRRGLGLAAIVHTAAQPSHDWAARDPQMDFTVNANGTLNLLEAGAELLSGNAVRLYLNEQSLRRHAEQPAAARAGVALGNRAGPRV